MWGRRDGPHLASPGLSPASGNLALTSFLTAAPEWPADDTRQFCRIRCSAIACIKCQRR
jgi:hypothetical protein